MPQTSFTRIEDAYAQLDEGKGDKLSGFEQVPWERFRPKLEEIWRKPASERKGPAGRKPWDAVLMFKALMLGRLNNLSDESLHYSLKDRISYARFIGLEPGDRVPNEKTLHQYRVSLGEEGMAELFAEFGRYLEEVGLQATEGHVVDSTYVRSPVQRNSREENEAIKGGGTPEGWKGNDAKLRQKDTDARWGKKNNEYKHGYKAHTNVCVDKKTICAVVVTAASVHDSQVLEPLVEGVVKKGAEVFGDSAYSSGEIEGLLSSMDLVSRINRKGYRGRKLSEADKRRNSRNSSKRVRVEHVFASFENDMGGKTVRSVGIERVTIDILMKCLGYNMRRFIFLLKQELATQAA